jgi:hypothetical protein
LDLRLAYGRAASLRHAGIAFALLVLETVKMANQHDTTRPEPDVKKASPAAPGDNRGADDVDGNRSGGASKSTGPTEPESASDRDDDGTPDPR